jgi:hypothetical protein
VDITFIRGNIVLFSTQFFDAAGAPQTPSAVELTLTTAPLEADPQTVTMPMSGGPVSVAEWDTTDISPGIVYWAVKATGPHAADEGFFFLDANLANQ